MAKIRKNINKKYQQPVYREKYPELFSSEFEDFFNNQIFPFVKHVDICNPMFNEPLPIDSKKRKLVLKTKFSFFWYVGIILTIFLHSIVPKYEFFIVFAGICLFVYMYVKEYSHFTVNKKKKSNYLEQVQELKTNIYTKLFSFYKEFKYQKFPSEFENKRLVGYDCRMLDYRGGASPSEYDDSFVITKNDFDIYMREINLSYYESRIQDEVLARKGGRALLYRVKLQKSFDARVIILRKIFELANSTPLDLNGFNDIKLESADFNKYFQVFANDEQVARLFVTPAFMSRLLDFVNLNEDVEIDISFEKGFLNIVVTVDELDMFEIGMDKDGYLLLENIQVYRNILIQLKESLSILDQLKIENIL